MSQEKTLKTIIKMLALAISNDFVDERISALNRVAAVLASNGMTIEDLLTGQGTALERLEMFDDFRASISDLEGKVAQLQSENASYRAQINDFRSQAPGESTRWFDFFALATTRFCREDGTMPGNWRSQVAHYLGVTSKAVGRWQRDQELIPQEMFDRILEVPEVTVVGPPEPSVSPTPPLVLPDEFLGDGIDGEFTIASRMGKRKVRWKPIELRRLYELCTQTHMSVPKIAEQMTRDFQRPISYEACNQQVKKHKIPRKIANSVLEEVRKTVDA